MKFQVLIFVAVCAGVLFIAVANRLAQRRLGAWLRSGALVIDVRSEAEYRAGHFGTAISMPIEVFERRLPEIEGRKGAPIILYCYAGSRSAVAASILKKHGFTKVINARSLKALARFEAGQEPQHPSTL